MTIPTSPTTPSLTPLQGIYTGTIRDSRPEALPDILGRIHEYGSAFSEKVQTIVQALQSHSDLDCRFLGVRLSFSDFYRSRREQTQQKA